MSDLNDLSTVGVLLLVIYVLAKEVIPRLVKKGPENGNGAKLQKHINQQHSAAIAALQHEVRSLRDILAETRTKTAVATEVLHRIEDSLSG